MITNKNKKFLAQYGSENHIDHLMKDESSIIQIAVAKNPNLKDHHIDHLMQNNDSVLCGLAQNPNLKDHHIDRLLVFS